MKKPAFRWIPLGGVAVVSSVFLLHFSSMASSPASVEEEMPEAQWSGGVALPVWGVGESREGFDVRIWPNEVLVWLEQENLRDLIADPEVSEEEKKSLREILAQQQLAWNQS